MKTVALPTGEQVSGMGTWMIGENRLFPPPKHATPLEML